MFTSHLAYHLNEETEFHSETDSTSSFHHSIATLSGHTSYISSLTLAGKFLYSGSSDGEIRLWKLDESDSNMVAHGKGAVKSMILLHDKLFSAHQDHRIRVWRLKVFNEQSQQSPRLDRVATLPTLSDRAMKLLNPNNQVEIRRHKKSTWVHHVDAVSALTLSADDSLLYSVSWDRTIKIWRTTDFKCLESVTRAHEDAINAIAVSVEGDIYTGSADATIKVWRKPPLEKKHSLVATLEKHKSGVNALVLSVNGSLLYSGASDKSVLVWEIKEGEDNIRVVVKLKGHSKPVLCLAVVSDLICSGSADKTIRVWKGYGGGNYSCLAVLEGHHGPVKCLAMEAQQYNSDDSPNTASNYLVYSGGLDCDVKVWQVYVPPY